MWDSGKACEHAKRCVSYGWWMDIRHPGGDPIWSQCSVTGLLVQCGKNRATNGCHCEDKGDSGDARLTGIRSECAAWNQIRPTHDASRVRLSAGLAVGTVCCWGLSSLQLWFSELCREKWRTQEGGTPPRGNLSTLVLKPVQCKKHVTDLLTLKRHKNCVALKHCWRGNMPVRVCAISFFSPPPFFFKFTHGTSVWIGFTHGNQNDVWS